MLLYYTTQCNVKRYFTLFGVDTSFIYLYIDNTTREISEINLLSEEDVMFENLRVHWQRGEKVALAARCDISPQYMSDLLCGRKRAIPELGLKLEEQAKAMGIHLTKEDMMFPHDSRNPLMNIKKG